MHRFPLVFVSEGMLFTWECFLSLWEKAVCARLAGEQHTAPLSVPWPRRAAVLSWIGTVKVKMGSKPYRTEHC